MRIVIILLLLVSQTGNAWELNPFAPKPQKRFYDPRFSNREPTSEEIEAMCNDIKERLDAKFKNDKDSRPEMWDKDWINKS